MIVKTAKRYRKFTISPLPMLFVKTTGNGFTRNNACAVLAYPPPPQGTKYFGESRDQPEPGSLSQRRA